MSRLLFFFFFREDSRDDEVVTGFEFTVDAIDSEAFLIPDRIKLASGNRNGLMHVEDSGINNRCYVSPAARFQRRNGVNK